MGGYFEVRTVKNTKNLINTELYLNLYKEVKKLQLYSDTPSYNEGTQGSEHSELIYKEFGLLESKIISKSCKKMVLRKKNVGVGIAI